MSTIIQIHYLIETKSECRCSLQLLWADAPASPVVIHIVDTMAKAFGSRGRNQDALP
jgi:hypothetical protein